MGIKKKSILIIGGGGSSGFLLSACMSKALKENEDNIIVMTAEQALEEGIDVVKTNKFEVSKYNNPIPIIEPNNYPSERISQIDAIIKNKSKKGKKKRW